MSVCVNGTRGKVCAGFNRGLFYLKRAGTRTKRECLHGRHETVAHTPGSSEREEGMRGEGEGRRGGGGERVGRGEVRGGRGRIKIKR